MVITKQDPQDSPTAWHVRFRFLLNTKDPTLANRTEAEEAMILKFQEEFIDEDVGLLDYAGDAGTGSWA